MLNLDLHPQLLDNYLHIKLNDVIVLLVWGLVSWICGKSTFDQFRAIKIGSFGRWFNTRDSGLLLVLIVMLSASSINYVYHMVNFISEQWSSELSPLLQCLQIYPALLMAVQSPSQALYFIQSYVCQSGRDSMKKRQVSEHIRLNATLILHSLCIYIVIQMCTTQPKILWEMVTGEVAYRAFSAYLFWRLLQQREGENVVHYDQGEVIEPEQEMSGATDANRQEMVITSIIRPLEDKGALLKRERTYIQGQLVSCKEAKSTEEKTELVV